MLLDWKAAAGMGTGNSASRVLLEWQSSMRVIYSPGRGGLASVYSVEGLCSGRLYSGNCSESRPAVGDVSLIGVSAEIGESSTNPRQTYVAGHM